MRSRLLTASGILATLLLAACGGGSTPAATTGGAKPATASTAPTTKTISAEFWSAPDGFNCITASSGYDESICSLMWDTLVWLSPDQQIHPLLASSWDVSPDSKTFTFHLNPSAKWTDGQPVTAQDVAYTLQISADPKVPAIFGSYLSILAGTNDQGQNVDPSQPLAGVKVVDAHTVQLLTKQPTDPTEVLQGIGNSIWIYPQHVLKTISDTDFAKAPFFQNPTVTDGPYEFVKYVNSQYVQLKPNPGYYLGAPKIDQLFIKVVPATSVLADLRDGTVDATLSPGESDVPLQDWPAIASLPNVKQDPVTGTVTQFMFINTAKPYLQSVQVRQALAMAINRDEIVQQLLKGQGYVPIGPVAKLYTTWYDKNIQPWPYDPTKAKQLLQAANFPMSQPLKLLVPTGNQIRMESAPLIQQDLQAVGLNVQIQQYDFATMLAQDKAGNFDFSLVGSGFGSDPSQFASFFSCKGALNYGKFCDPQVDKDFTAGNSTASTAQRQQIYDDLQQRIANDVPFVFLYTPNGLMAYNTALNAAAIPDAYGMQQPWLWDVSAGAQ
jgi:peptide/nickel transport system substrate-binding protein